MFWIGVIAGFIIGGFFGVMMLGLLTMARENLREVTLDGGKEACPKQSLPRQGAF